MAHFAQIDENNIVTQVIVVNNNELLDESGIEKEKLGIDFCSKLFGGKWIQTSYNNNFRKNFATIGYFYDEKNDAFIPPKPYNSWILNNNFIWEAPIPYPEGTVSVWNENLLSWELAPEY